MLVCDHCHFLFSSAAQPEQCPDCGKQVEIFGKSNLAEIALEYSLPVLARLPIDPNVAALCDAGKMEQADVSGVMPAAELMAKA